MTKETGRRMVALSGGVTGVPDYRERFAVAVCEAR